MESNESKAKAATPAQSESISTDRRAFMKTVVTGTVAAGLVASVGKAEAAAMDPCGNPVEVPQATVRAKVVLNASRAIDRQHIIDVIGTIFDGSNCPNCGLIGIPDDPRHVKDIVIGRAYLADNIPSLVVFEDP